MVDRVSKSIHPTGNTAIAETSSVHPQRLYRDIEPLAFGVPGTIDSDEKQRLLVGTTGGGWWIDSRCFFLYYLAGAEQFISKP